MGRSGISRRSQAWKESFHGQFKKTRLCRLYMEGCCPYDEECSFAHSFSEVRPAADLTKTSMCAAWQQGVCQKPAHECQYAHGRKDMRKTPAFIEGMPVPKDTAGGQVSGQDADVEAPVRPPLDEPMWLPHRWLDSSPATPDDEGDSGCSSGGDAKEAPGPHYMCASAAWLGEGVQWRAAAPPGYHGGGAPRHPWGEGGGLWNDCQGSYAAVPRGDTIADALSPTPPPGQEDVGLAYPLSFVPLKATPNIELWLITL